MTLVKPEPFNVRGKNYAVEMTTDVGFLATGLTPLKEAFGLEFGTGNPFALPCTPSLNTVVARGVGSGNERADKGKAGDKVAKGKGKDVTADRAATGKRAAARCPSVRGASEEHQKKVIPVRDATGDSTAGGGSGTLADDHSSGNTNKPPAMPATAEENEAGVEGSGGTLVEDGVVEVEVEVKVGPRQSDEEGRSSQKNPGQEGRRVEGGGEGGSASIHEVLRKLGDVDDEQRARLARAQRFLEEEVARQD